MATQPSANPLLSSWGPPILSSSLLTRINSGRDKKYEKNINSGEGQNEAQMNFEITFSYWPLNELGRNKKMISLKISILEDFRQTDCKHTVFWATLCPTHRAFSKQGRYPRQTDSVYLKLMAGLLVTINYLTYKKTDGRSCVRSMNCSLGMCAHPARIADHLPRQAWIPCHILIVHRRAGPHILLLRSLSHCSCAKLSGKSPPLAIARACVLYLGVRADPS